MRFCDNLILYFSFLELNKYRTQTSTVELQLHFKSELILGEWHMNDNIIQTHNETGTHA